MPSVAPPRLNWTEISRQRVQGHQRSVVKSPHSVVKNTRLINQSYDAFPFHSVIMTSGKTSQDNPNISILDSAAHRMSSCRAG